MFTLSFSALIVGFISICLSLILGLWLYYDRQTLRCYEHLQTQEVFHCIHCQYLYINTRANPLTNCPKCGTVNIPLRF